MYKKEFLRFYISLKEYDDFKFLISILKFNTAPTKARLKLGTMVNISDSSRVLKSIWDKNKQYVSKILGLDFFELRRSSDSVLVYFYDQKRLEIKLKENKITSYLRKFGYINLSDYYAYLLFLRDRFSNIKNCPNEIGIFLGYPLLDVIDFDCKSCSCKFVGYWKCYNNVDSSKKAFEKYDKEKLKIIKEICLDAVAK